MDHCLICNEHNATNPIVVNLKMTEIWFFENKMAKLDAYPQLTLIGLIA